MTTANSNDNIIFTPGSAFGGWEYRVIRIGTKIGIQSCGPEESIFETKVTITYDAWSDLYDTHDHILNDPSWLSGFIAKKVSEHKEYLRQRFGEED